jgi:hypothetical protein
MSLLNPDSHDHARAIAATWFARLPTGPVFMTGDSKTYRLSEEQAVALRKEAETELARLHRRMRLMMYLWATLLVALIAASFLYKDALPAVLRDHGSELAWTLYSLHGVWIIIEAIRNQRGITAYRDELAARFAFQVPLPETVAEQVTGPNPYRIALYLLIVCVAGVTLAAEQLAHRGIDLIDAVPRAIFLLIAPLAWGMWWFSDRFDRRRGVG